MGKQTLVAFAVAAGMVTGLFGAPEAHAAPHPIGVNIKSPDGTISMVTLANERRPYTSAGAFLSYGFNSFANISVATTEDLAMTAGNFIPPQDGKIICSDRGSDKGTCYLITDGKKAGFTSAAVFAALGFSFKNSTSGDVSFMSDTSVIATAEEGHRTGVLVNNSGTIFLIGTGVTLGIPSVDTFRSWGYDFKDVVTANQYDKVLSQSGVMQYRTQGQLSPLTTSYEQVPPSFSLTPVPAPTYSPPVTNKPALSQVIAQWRPRTVLLICFIQYSNGTEKSQSGSGYFTQSEDGPIIITNEHVVSFGKYSADYCGAWLPDDKNDDVVVIDDSEINYDPSDKNDLARLEVKNPSPQMKTISGWGTLCTQRSVIGERIVILGYPGVGSLEDITATEGIISGYDGLYYTTSAKIESGNSGGLAVSIDNNCYLGIPTATVTGNYESLGRILDFSQLGN